MNLAFGFKVKSTIFAELIKFDKLVYLRTLNAQSYFVLLQSKQNGLQALLMLEILDVKTLQHLNLQMQLLVTTSSPRRGRESGKGPSLTAERRPEKQRIQCNRNLNLILNTTKVMIFLLLLFQSSITGILCELAMSNFQCKKFYPNLENRQILLLSYACLSMIKER